MRTRPLKSFRAILAAAGASAVARPAFACGICGITVSYNAFRFLPAWFYLFILWIPVAAYAGWAARGELPARKAVWRWARGPVKLALLSLVMTLNGGHLLMMFFFPYVLLKTAWPGPWKKVDQGWPRWFTLASRAWLALLLASIPVSYSLLPLIENELNIMSFRSRAKTQMRLIAGLIEVERKNEGRYPLARMIGAGGESFSAIADAQRFAGEGGSLWSDPFGYERRICPIVDPAIIPSAIGASLTGYGMGPPWFPYMGARCIGFDSIQYFGDEESFVLVSRGPDLKFEITPDSFGGKPIADWAASDARPESTYDPTNGMESAGDIIRFGGRAEEAAKASSGGTEASIYPPF